MPVTGCVVGGSGSGSGSVVGRRLVDGAHEDARWVLRGFGSCGTLCAPTIRADWTTG